MFAPVPEYKNKALLLTQRLGGIFQKWGATVILGLLKQKSEGAQAPQFRRLCKVRCRFMASPPCTRNDA